MHNEKWKLIRGIYGFFFILYVVIIVKILSFMHICLYSKIIHVFQNADFFKLGYYYYILLNKILFVESNNFIISEFCKGKTLSVKLLRKFCPQSHHFKIKATRKSWELSQSHQDLFSSKAKFSAVPELIKCVQFKNN